MPYSARRRVNRFDRRAASEAGGASGRCAIAKQRHLILMIWPVGPRRRRAKPVASGGPFSRLAGAVRELNCLRVAHARQTKSALRRLRQRQRQRELHRARAKRAGAPVDQFAALPGRACAALRTRSICARRSQVTSKPSGQASRAKPERLRRSHRSSPADCSHFSPVASH